MREEEAKGTALSAVLKMAEDLEKQGELNQAFSAYSKVIRFDPDAKEAATAREAILKLARGWEEKGKRYQALKAYERVIYPVEDYRFPL